VWVDTVEAFGTLMIADVLEPAIRLAEGGFVPFVLYFSTLASLGLISSAPVSELHSAAVCSRVMCIASGLTRETSGSFQRRQSWKHRQMETKCFSMDAPQSLENS